MGRAKKVKYSYFGYEYVAPTPPAPDDRWFITSPVSIEATYIVGDFSPEGITRAVSSSGWGAGVESCWGEGSTPIIAEAVKVFDNSSSNLGCDDSPANAYLGKIAVVSRGTCEFSFKALKAEEAGAVAVIVINLEGFEEGVSLGAGSFGYLVNIPVISCGWTLGQSILAELDSLETVNMKLGYL